MSELQITQKDMEIMYKITKESGEYNKSKKEQK